MKRPLLDQIDRVVLRELPDSYYASKLKLYLAWKHLLREIEKLFRSFFIKKKK